MNWEMFHRSNELASRYEWRTIGTVQRLLTSYHLHRQMHYYYDVEITDTPGNRNKQHRIILL